MFTECSNKSWLRCSNPNNTRVIMSFLEKNGKRSNKLWLETCTVMVTSNKKISAFLTCHTIAGRNELTVCPELFWPSHQMFPRTTHHTILSLDRGISHGNMHFTPFIISHLQWIFFSLILCWKHFSPLAGLVSETTWVSCTCCSGKYSNQ